MLGTWIYLTDMAPKATIWNPETDETREVMSAAVLNAAPAGLRRMTLRELSGGRYEETGEFAPLTPALFAELEDHYHAPNNWNYDWPHPLVETEIPEGLEASVRERLEQMMAVHPFDFAITGLQRRYLMYFSDGDYTSQARFERLIPAPDSYPFRQDGALRKRYDWIWNSGMRDAKAPKPPQAARYGSSARPCLYLGPAWVVRFRLDDQDPLLDRCRVYVTDQAEFICSDWCQRHDFSSYGKGINLQQGIYTFDGWVVNSCVAQAMSRGSFKPKQVKITRDKVRELAAKEGTRRPPVSYAEARERADQLIAQLRKDAPPPPIAAAPVAPAVEVGEPTADILAEAEAELQAQLYAKSTPVTMCAKFPSGTVIGDLPIYGQRITVQHRGPEQVVIALGSVLTTHQAFTGARKATPPPIPCGDATLFLVDRPTRKVTEALGSSWTARVALPPEEWPETVAPGTTLAAVLDALDADTVYAVVPPSEPALAGAAG